MNIKSFYNFVVLNYVKKEKYILGRIGISFWGFGEKLNFEGFGEQRQNTSMKRRIFQGFGEIIALFIAIKGALIPLGASVVSSNSVEYFILEKNVTF